MTDKMKSHKTLDEAHSSLTQTTVLKGAFQTDQSTKKEFFDNIKLQQEFAPR
jgi:GTP cyclohydrolase I